MIYCPLCKRNGRLIWKEKKHRVYRCKNCKVAFLSPLPENLEKVYNQKYFQDWYIPCYQERKAYIEKLFSFIEKYIENKGKLLDVGCGIGILLEVAKEKGWDVYGQDISPFAIEYCRSKGFYVYDKPISELNIPKNTFDIITLFDVIAHLKDPVSYINTCIKLLRTGGYLIIKTPYHSPLLFFIANLLSFTGKSRSLLHIPAQIFHFNPQSLKTILIDNFLLLKSIKLYDFSSLQIGKFIYIPKNKSIISIWQKNKKTIRE